MRGGGTVTAGEGGDASWTRRPSPGWPSRSRARRWVCNFRLLMPPVTADKIMEKLVSLAKRRGFVFQSSEIYGGLWSVWGYRPLGVGGQKKIQKGRGAVAGAASSAPQSP